MKPLQLALLGFALLSGGCILIPSPYSAQLKPVITRYSAVETGTKRSEIEARLGQPIRQEESGPCVWETRFDEVNYAMIKVWFDGDDTANKVEVTRAHGKVAPGFRASAKTTHSQ